MLKILSSLVSVTSVAFVSNANAQNYAVCDVCGPGTGPPANGNVIINLDFLVMPLPGSTYEATCDEIYEAGQDGFASPYYCDLAHNQTDIQESCGCPPAENRTLEGIISENSELSYLVDFLIFAGLAPYGILNAGFGDYSVFAPDNSAFEALGNDFISRLSDPKWIAHLVDLLLYHIAYERVDSRRIPIGETQVNMFNGEDAFVSKDQAGFISVSYPVEYGSFSADITNADIRAKNGIAHVINGVLMPSSAFKSLKDIAPTLENYSILNALIEPFLGFAPSGDFTVLAPSNAAFQALGDDFVTNLQCPENIAELQRLTFQHIIPDIISSYAIPSYEISIPTLGRNLTAVNAGDFTFNGARVFEADILAKDGIVHGINKVLVPEDFDLVTCASVAPPTASPSVATGPEEGIGSCCIFLTRCESVARCCSRRWAMFGVISGRCGFSFY